METYSRLGDDISCHTLVAGFVLIVSLTQAEQISVLQPKTADEVLDLSGLNISRDFFDY